MNKEKIPAADLPFNFDGCEDQYGIIKFGEAFCPGVYYTVTRLPHSFCGEYIVATEDSPAVSSKAKSYGKLLSTTPPVLLCELEYFDKGRWVVITKPINIWRSTESHFRRGNPSGKQNCVGWRYARSILGSSQFQQIPLGAPLSSIFASGMDWIG